MISFGLSLNDSGSSRNEMCSRSDRNCSCSSEVSFLLLSLSYREKSLETSLLSKAFTISSSRVAWVWVSVFFEASSGAALVWVAVSAPAVTARQRRTSARTIAQAVVGKQKSQTGSVREVHLLMQGAK